MTVQPIIAVPSQGLGIMDGLGFDWGGIVNKGVDITGDILRSTVGTPAGTYTRTGADGSTVVYRQPSGSIQNIFGAQDTTTAIGGSLQANNAAATASGISTLLLFGVGALALVMFTRR